MENFQHRIHIMLSLYNVMLNCMLMYKKYTTTFYIQSVHSGEKCIFQFIFLDFIALQDHRERHEHEYFNIEC